MSDSGPKRPRKRRGRGRGRRETRRGRPVPPPPAAGLRETPLGRPPSQPPGIPVVSAPVERLRKRSPARTTSPKSLNLRPARGSAGPVEGLPDFLRGGRSQPPAAPPATDPDEPPAAPEQAFDPASSDALPRPPPSSRRRGSASRVAGDQIAGDFRKPQLSTTVHAPLSDRARRRPSDEMPAGRKAPRPSRAPRVSAPHEAVQAAPKAVQELHSERTEARIRSGELELPATGRQRWLDYRIPTLLAGLLVGGSMLLPISAESTAPGWQSLLGKLEIPWFGGLVAGLGAAAVAVLVSVVAWAREDLLPDTDDDLPASGWLLMAGAFATVAVVLRAAAEPELMGAAMAPMRSGLLGVPPVIWGAIAAGGLVQLADGRRPRSARAIAGAAGLGLLIISWMPIGWLGSARIPAIAAFSADSSPFALGAARITSPLMAAPGLVMVQALLGPAILAALLWSARFRRLGLWAVALAALIVPCLDPLAVASEGAGPAAVGGALMWFGLALLTAVASALALDRVVRIGPSESREEVERAVVTVVVVVWVLAKINGLRYSATDESIYFYAARAWADGIWPYHDFFFSHPPLHILPLALVYAVIGPSVLAGKLMSVLAALVAGLTTWRLGRDFIGPLAGVAALILFVFASETLRASTNLTGINLTTMWAMLGFAAGMWRRTFLAGMLLGIALCTGVYAAAIVVALALLAAFAPRPSGSHRGLLHRLMGAPITQLLFGFALVFGAVNLLFFLMAPESYVDGVYRYHFLKAAKTPGFRPMTEGLGAILGNLVLMLEGRDFTIATYYHAAQFWLALLAPAGVAIGIAVRRVLLRAATDAGAQTVSARKRRRRQRPNAADRPDHGNWTLLIDPRLWWLHPRHGGFTMVVCLVLWALVAEFAQFKERYSFYWVLLLPFAALAAASWISSLLRVGAIAIGAGWRWRRSPGEDLPQPEPAPRWPPKVAAVALLATMLWVPINSAANRRAWPGEFSRKDPSGAVVASVGERLNFDWTPTPGPDLLSYATRALLWKPYRLRGNVEYGLHHYLWSKKRWFSTADEIAAYIREHSSPDDTITGSSTHAPLIALLAGRRMAGDHVDTNSKVFKTGVVSRRAFWDRACADRLRYIVAGPMSFFSPRLMHRKPTVARNFHLVKTFADPTLKHWRTVVLQLWERNDPSGKVPCRYVPPGEPRP